MDELMHYGVLGMKWGVRRANSRIAKNQKYQKQVAKYEKKAAAATVRSEKAHHKIDLNRANRVIVKSAKYKKKSTAYALKAVKETDPTKTLKYEKKAAKYNLKYAKSARIANTISRSTGYGRIAMKHAIKSDKFKAKAAKAKYKIERNNLYAHTMQKKISALSSDEINKGRLFIQGL